MWSRRSPGKGKCQKGVEGASENWNLFPGVSGVESCCSGSGEEARLEWG
jgi:hypothetical protein